MKTIDDFSREKLMIGPTPLYRLENISRTLGKNIWIKRDDLTGVALGGNKVRKLEFLLADAVNKGAKTVYTTGGAQSNHAMLTAACCLRLGLEPVLLLKQRGVCTRRGNLLLDWLMDADVRFVDTDSFDDIYTLMDELGRKTGAPYYKIPVGGSVPLGSLGYIDCVREISRQTRELGVHINRIVCATGSGGTHAGVTLGTRMYMPETAVTGMAVDTQNFERIVPEIMRGAAALLELDPLIAEEGVDVRPLYGPGYALPSQEGSEAIRLMARQEGIFLDPVYTGKTFAGLLSMVRSGELDGEENIVFLFTGGAGGLFAIDFD